MGVQERRSRQKEELRQEILDAARDLFVTEGYEAVSMRKIAEKIEYSPTTIYLYFKDKSDVLFSLCEETFSKLTRKLESIDKKELDPLTALKKGLRAYVDFGLKHPNHYKITFMREYPREEDPERIARNMEIGMAAFSCLLSSVTACVERNLFRETNVELISQGLWAGVHGITSLLIIDCDFPWLEKSLVIDHLIDTMVTGLERR
jgi:AcrR family transcriptional regulator